MAEPPKLELLTRTSGTTEFHIDELQSHAHRQFRPRRLPEQAWQVTPQPQSPDGTRAYMLKNLRQERYLLLNSREYYLWQMFDGTHSLEEIARAFHLEFGSFDYDAIRQLLTKMYQAGLLMEPSHLALQPSRSESIKKLGLRRIARSWHQLSFVVPGADELCSQLYRYGGFLLISRISFALVIMTAVAAAGAALNMSTQAQQFTQSVSVQPWTSALLMLGALLVTSMLHVLVHALACKAYNRRVRGLGFFLLQGVLPTFYADVTDIFMSTRSARVIVDIAGPMVEVLLGSVAFLIAYQSPAGFGQAIGFGIGVLLWEGALINLYPFSFLELDGYNIIADVFAMPTLRQQALALAPQLPRLLLNMSKIRRAEWLQIAYLLLCTLSVLIYIIAHLDALRAILPYWN
jgi:hypothetical protein